MDIVDSVRGVYPFETFLTRWCGSETIRELRKGNVAQFLAWALFSTRVEDLLPRDYVMLHRMVEMVDRRFELHLEEGLNPEARTLRMTLEPLQVIHRPLCMYVFTAVMPRLLGNACLRLQGFTRHELNDTAYWYRAGRECTCGHCMRRFFFGGGGCGGTDRLQRAQHAHYYYYYFFNHIHPHTHSQGPPRSCRSSSSTA